MIFKKIIKKVDVMSPIPPKWKCMFENSSGQNYIIPEKQF